MSFYLLDTDVLSQLINKRQNLSVIRKLATLPAARQFASTISIAELYYGASLAAPALNFCQAIEEKIIANVQIIPFDLKAAQQYGQLRSHQERLGRPLAMADLMIASIALVNHLILATGNIRHFSQVPGLQVEDWFS